KTIVQADWNVDVTRAGVVPGNKALVSGGAGNMLAYYELKRGSQMIPRPLNGHSGRVLSLAVTRDGRHALSGSEDRTLRLWDLASGAELRCLRGHTGPVLSVALAPEGRQALSGSQDGTVRFWALPAGGADVVRKPYPSA